MLEIVTFPCFQDAYIAVLKHVLERHEHTVAPRGNACRECLNVSFAVADPRNRIVYMPQRRTNIVFCYAEALWYLLGRDDLEMICYYAPSLRKFSADGQRLTGSAYGPRLFRPAHEGGVSQWQRVLEVLADDPASKRAVMTVFHPAELDDGAHPDVSCTLTVQFLLRDGALHTVVSMRGNDAVVGLVSDVFAFTLLAEFTAHQLGAGLGSYAHHVASLHINDVDQVRAARVTTAAPHAGRARFAVPVMPPTRWSDLSVVQQYEGALRRNEDQLHPGDLGLLGLPGYWQQVLLLFEVHRQISHYPGTPVEIDTLEALDPGYRWLIANRWPDHLPETFVLPSPERGRWTHTHPRSRAAGRPSLPTPGRAG